MKSAMTSSASSRPTDTRSKPGGHAGRGLLLGREAGVGGGHRMAHQRLGAAERGGAARPARTRSRSCLGGVAPAGELEREDGAELAHLPLGEVVLRVRREPGVVHLRHGRMLLEPLAQSLCGRRLVGGADRHRADAAQRVERVERRRHRAVQHAVRPDRVDQLALGRDDADRGVVVAGDALRRRVHDDVDAVRERLLAERRGERGVERP